MQKIKGISFHMFLTRGIWTIDQLKRASRVAEMLVVGVDPGKRELVCCVNKDGDHTIAFL